MRRATRLLSLPMLLGLACQSQQHPTDIERAGLDEVVSAYTASVLTKNSTSLELAVLLVINESDGDCNLFVSNYYAEVLCSMHPYATINGRKVYINRMDTNCFEESLPSSSPQKDPCRPLDDAVPMPTYDPSTWVYKLVDGRLVRQEI